jgi:hypothetical protein
MVNGDDEIREALVGQANLGIGMPNMVYTNQR